MKQKKSNPADWMTVAARGLFLFLVLWILGLSCTSIQLPGSMATFASKPWLTLILAAGSVTLFLLFYLFAKSRLIRQESCAKLTLAGSVLLILLLQLFCIFILRIQFRYDSLEVFEEACRLLKTGQIANWDYFGANAHQRGTLYLTWGLLKIASRVHIPETMYVLYLDLWCMVFVDSCLVGAGAYIYNKRGIRGAALYGLICLLHPFTYLWCGFYYTTIQCLPFMTLFLLLILLKPQCKKIWHNILLGALLGINCYIGNHIRPTVLIALAAWLIYIVMQRFTSAGEKRRGWTGALGAVAAFCIVFLALGQMYNRLDEKLVTIDTDAYERPMLFWVAMSAKGDGTWDGYDAEMLAKYPSKAEKSQYAEELLKERITSLDAAGILGLVSNKLRVTWAEGNDDAISENATSLTYGRLYDVLLGDDSLIFLYYCQIFRVLLLFCVAAGAISSFRKRGFTELDYMRVAVLGGILFHILWEAKRLYSIPFMPFLLVLMFEGMWQLTGERECEETQQNTATGLRSKQLLTLLPAVSAVLTVAWCIAMGGRLTETEYEAHYYRASQLMERCDIKRGLAMGECIRQEFMASEPFDTVGIQIRNYSWYYGAENESVYRMKIEDSKGCVLREEMIYGSDFEDYEFCDTRFETIVPKAGGELYYVTIETVNADDVSYLVFYKKTSEAIDPYPWGSYVENGVTMEQADLTFRVFKQEKKMLLSAGGMLAFGGGLLVLQLLQFFLLRRLRNCKKEPIK